MIVKGDAEVDWLERAACRRVGVDPEIFFPSAGAISARLPALRVCAECPVKPECREWTLRIDQGLGPSKIFGVSGGLIERERIRLYNVERNSRRTFRTCRGSCGRLVFSSAQRDFAPEGAVRLEREGMCFQCWNKSKKEGEGSR